MERRGGGLGGLVFGTLLGPEATGPVGSFGVFPGLFVSGFLAAPIMHVWLSFVGAGVWGVWFGVVV